MNYTKTNLHVIEPYHVAVDLQNHELYLHISIKNHSKILIYGNSLRKIIFR